MSEFKDMLKYYRMRDNLSQAELAKKLGLSASTISMYEVGKREPDFETEEMIADFFNVDLNTLRGKDTEIQLQFNSTERRLLAYFNALNGTGQEKLLEYAEDIQDKYRKEK